MFGVLTATLLPLALRMAPALKKLTRCLKGGGKILFRDYGRLDMAQLRLKPGNWSVKSILVGTAPHTQVSV